MGTEAQGPAGTQHTGSQDCGGLMGPPRATLQPHPATGHFPSCCCLSKQWSAGCSRQGQQEKAEGPSPPTRHTFRPGTWPQPRPEPAAAAAYGGTSRLWRVASVAAAEGSPLPQSVFSNKHTWVTAARQVGDGVAQQRAGLRALIHSAHLFCTSRHPVLLHNGRALGGVHLDPLTAPSTLLQMPRPQALCTALAQTSTGSSLLRCLPPCCSPSNSISVHGCPLCASACLNLPEG